MMAEPYDRLLIGPTTEQLLQALRDACAVAAQVQPFHEMQRYPWGPFLQRVAVEPEGHRLWEQPGVVTPYLTLSWWTDHQGTRHYRVCGGDARAARARTYSSCPDARPPLWHVHPDRLFCRTETTWSGWLSVCPCGVTGLPADLAWMGEECGPCHDRRQEGEANVDGPLAWTLEFSPSPNQIVAVSADRRYVAVGKRGDRVEVFDQGSCRRYALTGNHVGKGEVASLAFSPDGQYLALAFLDSGVCVVNHQPGEAPGAIPYGPSEGVARVAFSPEGELLATLHSGEGVQLWRREPRGIVREYQDATAFDFLPSGALLLGERHGLVRCVEPNGDWKETTWFQTPATATEEVLLVGAGPGKDSVVLILGESENQVDLSRFVRREKCRLEGWQWKGASWVRTFCLSLPRLTLAGLSPDGTYLASVIHDLQHSPSAITFHDLAAGRECGTLEWDPQEMINDLTFTSDGRMLVTAGGRGAVKLWPWRQLLEG